MAGGVVFERGVSKSSAGTWIGLAAVVPILFAVVLAMNLYIGERKLPSELRGTTPWFAGGLVVSSAMFGGVWWRARRRLTLVEQGGVQVLTIDDRPPVLIQGPFTVDLGWAKMAVGNGLTMTQVQVVFRDGDRVPLVITEAWGALYGAPDWPEGLHDTAGAEAVYSPAATGMVMPLLEVLDQA